jgi:transposase-like protein
MKQRNRGGRPCKLTMTAALRIVSMISQANSIAAAARSAGVGPSTVYRWVALGRKGDPRFEALAEAVQEVRGGGWLETLCVSFGNLLMKKGF